VIPEMCVRTEREKYRLIDKKADDLVKQAFIKISSKRSSAKVNNIFYIFHRQVHVYFIYPPV